MNQAAGGAGAGSAPRVSIALPVFNGERYLEQAITSVLTQTFDEFEFLIGDNASTDATEEICRSYAASDPRVRYVRNTTNLGAAPNYNQLFHRSGGEYFKWIAHDDLCEPEFIERSVAVLDHDPGVVICYSKTVLIDALGDEIEHYSDGLHMTQTAPHERVRLLLETPGWCNPIFGLLRRSMLAATPLIASYPRSDRTLLAELSLHGRFHELPEPLLKRRVHPQISTEVHVAERDLAVWFDARNRTRRTFPRWKRYSQYIAMAARAPLPAGERARVLGVVAGNAMSLSKVRGLASDVVSSLPIKRA